MDPQELIDDLNDVLLSDYYRFIEILGQGSFGIVVAAYSSQMDKVVAVKVMYFSPQITKYFEQDNESDLLQECSHPNIVKLYKVLIANNNIYLIMERLQGTTLDVILRTTTIDESEIRNIMLQVLNALVFLHRKGIIHRDLKPDNIFICENNYVKLIDLGLGYQIICRGFVGQQVGTPYYIAPEVINGLEQTQAVDIFGLGIIFYQMITGNKHPLWVEGQCKKDYYKLISSEFSIQFLNISEYSIPSIRMAKDFVENTVTFNAIDRMTAEQCLEHPWILGEERKSHPITNKEIKQRYAFTGKLSIIIKGLWMLKLLKEQCQEEIHYMKTQCSDEVDESEDLPMTSRVHTETVISLRNQRSLRKPESSKSIKLTKTTSHQDLTIMKNRLLNSKKLLIPRYKHSVDVLLPPKMNSQKRISQLPQISPNVTRQSSFNFRLA